MQNNQGAKKTKKKGPTTKREEFKRKTKTTQTEELKRGGKKRERNEIAGGIEFLKETSLRDEGKVIFPHC